MSDGGKGDKPRPFQVANEEYAQRWDLIFGRDNEKKNTAPTLEVVESFDTRPNGRSDNRIQSVGQTENKGTGGN
jgi:hypothetical protein